MAGFRRKRDFLNSRDRGSQADVSQEGGTEVLYPRCAALDVDNDTMACARIAGRGKASTTVRSFATRTASLPHEGPSTADAITEHIGPPEARSATVPVGGPSPAANQLARGDRGRDYSS